MKPTKRRRSPAVGLLAAAALLLLTMPASLASPQQPVPAEPQATFTVNSDGDESDFKLDGICDVTDGSQVCTLRAALEEANNDPGGGPHRIRFAIDGSGPHPIAPATPLPDIAAPVQIDGVSQPGAACPTGSTAASLQIILDGSKAGASNGLTLAAGSDGSTVRGLVIQLWEGNGIQVESNDNAVICNHIGIDAGGTTAAGNTVHGVNVISAGNQIGGTSAGERNVISGNGVAGIYLQTSGATGNQIQGNYLGTERSATAAVPNGEVGVRLQAADGNQIGGTQSGAGNIISGNGTFGVNLRAGSDDNRVQGNIIGLDISGSAAVANGSTGILVRNSDGNRIGGSTGGAGNVVSGNAGTGIYLLANDAGETADSNEILGNIVGLDASGAFKLANNAYGVLVAGGDNNIVGSTSGPNVIAGNGNDEIEIRDGNFNFVDSNRIGTDISGVNLIDDGDIGREGLVLDNAEDNTIIRNTIAGRTGHGIEVVGAGVRNAIYANSIYDNGGLGIDLGDDGVDANDPGDPDAGDNEKQNYPVLTSVTRAQVKGTLDSLSGDMDIHVYVNDACDPLGYGEGQEYVGLHEFVLPGIPASFIYYPASNALAIGRYVTVTATDLPGNTSEFSACMEVVCSDPDVTNDGSVGVADIIAVASTWNNGVYNPVYDQNCDDVVDIADVMLVAAAFGS